MPLAGIVATRNGGLIDEDGGWWVGVQHCAAGIAIASALALASTQTAAASQQQFNDELPPAPVVDEDLWQNPVLPAPAQWTVFLPAADSDFSPFQPDEDYWVNAVPPQPAALGRLYLPDPEEIPAGNLYGQPDEDFWQNPVAPVPVTVYQRLPLGDVEELPAASLHGQPDEDFWVNPVAPAPVVLAWPQPWSFEQNEPGGLYGQFDEDFWTNPVAPPAGWNLLSASVDSEFAPAVVSFQPDEDSWALPPPQQQTTPPAKVFAEDELPAAGLHGQPDEDFWSNPVAPTLSGQNFVPGLALANADAEFAPPAVGFTPDEDYWINPAATASWNPWPQQFAFDNQEPAGSLYIVAEEVFWSPPAPALVVFRAFQPWADSEIPVFAAPVFHADEDYWINPVALAGCPLCALNRILQQSSGDTEYRVQTSFVIWIADEY